MHKPGLMHPTVYNKALSPSVRVKLRPFQPVYRNRLWLQLYHTQLHQTAGTENSPLLKTVLLQIVFVIPLASYLCNYVQGWSAVSFPDPHPPKEGKSLVVLLNLSGVFLVARTTEKFLRIVRLYTYIQVLYKYAIAGWHGICNHGIAEIWIHLYDTHLYRQMAWNEANLIRH